MLHRLLAVIWFCSFSWISAVAGSPQDQPLTSLGAEGLAKRAQQSVAVVLIGEGAGRVSAIGTAAVVDSSGSLLTAYHLVQHAKEVQIRLHTGEVYDQVELMGFDERRDIAALRIPATGLPALQPGSVNDIAVGQKVYVVSNPSGLTWTISDGILSATRQSDDVPGAGKGYRLIQFTCPVSPGSSGGALVDSMGRLLAIVTGAMSGAGLGFGVPAESVMGLIRSYQRMMLGSGKNLDLKPPASPSSASVRELNPDAAVTDAKTLFISSRTSFFTPAALERELAKQKQFEEWNLKIVQDPRLADLKVEVDRPLFTYDFTYTVIDSKSTVVVASGKVTAIDGVRAASGIAKRIVQQMAKSRDASAKKETPKAEK